MSSLVCGELSRVGTVRAYLASRISHLIVSYRISHTPSHLIKPRISHMPPRSFRDGRAGGRDMHVTFTSLSPHAYPLVYLTLAHLAPNPSRLVHRGKRPSAEKSNDMQQTPVLNSAGYMLFFLCYEQRTHMRAHDTIAESTKSWSGCPPFLCWYRKLETPFSLHVG